MEIRVAKPEDYSEIYRLVKTAFQTAQVSDGTEQEFVLELCASSGYIPEWSSQLLRKIQSPAISC